jgi:hypothetical protein
MARKSLEVGRQEKEKEMTQVALYDQYGTRFADFYLPELPRVDDEIEIALPNEQLVKIFTVERVVHRMIYKTEHVQNDIDTPWYWEIGLHGSLYVPRGEKCTCAQGVTKCEKHGDQPADREVCPKCGTAVLGYCAAGVYCTSESCQYAC